MDASTSVQRCSSTFLCIVVFVLCRHLANMNYIVVLVIQRFIILYLHSIFYELQNCFHILACCLSIFKHRNIIAFYFVNSKIVFLLIAAFDLLLLAPYQCSSSVYTFSIERKTTARRHYVHWQVMWSLTTALDKKQIFGILYAWGSEGQ